MLLLPTFTYPPYCVAQDYLVQENRDGYQVEEKELKKLCRSHQHHNFF